MHPRHHKRNMMDSKAELFEYEHLHKSENDLQKGSLQRKWPFNPVEDVPVSQRRIVEEWAGGASPDPQSVRGDIKKPTGKENNALNRGLHKLHGKTKARRNPETGEREFLLHRGMGVLENHYMNNSPFTDDKSSWTPDYGVAHSFAETYLDQDKDNWTEGDLKREIGHVPKLDKPLVRSAWIPEKHIAHIPNTIGSAAANPDNARAIPDKIDGVSINRPHNRREDEVIVNPHQIQLTDYAPEKQDNSIHSRINSRKFGKSENDLQKGAARKQWPFNPVEDVPQKTRDDVTKLVSGSTHFRDRISEPEGREKNALNRGLHKLHGLTQARKNPNTGEREFLLHRGVDTEEAGKIKSGKLLENRTSWTPDFSVADSFANDYADSFTDDYKTGIDKKTFSAWIPEKHIAHIPNTIGQAKSYRRPRSGKEIKSNALSHEHEVVVNPHQFQLTPYTHEEEGEEKSLHSRINARKFSKSENDLQKAYKKNGTWYPEHSDKDGVPHPEHDHKVKTTAANNKPVWKYTDEVANQHEQDLMTHYSRWLKKTPFSSQNRDNVRKMAITIAKDPDRHVLSSGTTPGAPYEHKELRLRHLLNAVKGRPGYQIAEHPEGGVLLSADRHSKNKNNLNESSTWHFDGEKLKFLGDVPISNITAQGSPNEQANKTRNVDPTGGRGNSSHGDGPPRNEEKTREIRSYRPSGSGRVFGKSENITRAFGLHKIDVREDPALVDFMFKTEKTGCSVRDRKSHFIFSPEAPLYPPKLEMKFDDVLGFLEDKGYNVEKIKGKYEGIPQDSILVHNVPKSSVKHLFKLAENLGQESSIYSDGFNHELHFHNGEKAGTHYKGQGSDFPKREPEDNYSTLSDGAHFSHILYLDKPYTMKDSKIKGQVLESVKKSEIDDIFKPKVPQNSRVDILDKNLPETKLVHYSPEEGLKTIEPEHHGKRGIGAEAKQGAPEHKMSFFYREGVEPEKVVTTGAKKKYVVQLGGKKLYDIFKDRDNLREKAKQNAPSPGHRGPYPHEVDDQFHQEIKDAGYHGIFNSGFGEDHTMGNVVAMFDPMEVHSEHDLHPRDYRKTSVTDHHEDDRQFKKAKEVAEQIGHHSPRFIHNLDKMLKEQDGK